MLQSTVSKLEHESWIAQANVSSAHAAVRCQRHLTAVLLLLFEICLRSDQALAAEIHQAHLLHRIQQERSRNRIRLLALLFFGAVPVQHITVSWTTYARSTVTLVAHGSNGSESHSGQINGLHARHACTLCGTHYDTRTRTDIVDAQPSHDNSHRVQREKFVHRPWTRTA
jgi:hypothetical protein